MRSRLQLSLFLQLGSLHAHCRRHDVHNGSCQDSLLSGSGLLSSLSFRISQIVALKRASGQCTVFETSSPLSFTFSRYLFSSLRVLSPPLRFYSFDLSVILVRRAQRFVNSFKRREEDEKDKRRKGRTRFPLKKVYCTYTASSFDFQLALNVATFAVLNFPYIFWCTWLLAHLDPCYFQVSQVSFQSIVQRNLNDLAMWASFVRLSLLIRITVDPILAFITDFQVRSHCRSLVLLSFWVRESWLV